MSRVHGINNIVGRCEGKMKRNRLTKLNMTWMAVKAVLRVSPVASIYVLVYLSLSSLSGSISGLLIEEITNAVLQKNTRFIQYVIVYVTFFVVLQLASFGYAVAMNTCVFEKVTDEMNSRLATAMVSISYDAVENKEKLDQIYRARECVEDEQISECFMQAVRLFGTVLAIGSAFFVIGKWCWILPFLLLAFHIPETLIRKRAVREETEAKEKTVTLEREKDELWNTFYKKEAAKEIRTFGIGERLLDFWQEKNKYLYLKEWAIEKKKTDRLLAAQILKVIGFMSCLVILGIQHFQQEILAGAIAGAVTLIPSFQASLAELTERWNRLQQNLFYLENYFTIVENRAGYSAETLSVDKQITVDRLSFSYDTGEEILKEISFSINKGEKVAIVGENGAGKSTLVKCLLGLYPTQSGSICYDDVCLQSDKQYDYKNISLMAHEFGRYRMTTAENIGFGQAEQVDVSKLGLKNVFLGKEDGGEELSGGQWQKIALARCLQKKAQFYILDEPTASMDPVHEREAIKEILGKLQEKTVLLITHRIGFCREMDKILVMKSDHTLAGIGNHEELMTNCSTYQKLYESQAKWY